MSRKSAARCKNLQAVKSYARLMRVESWTRGPGGVNETEKG